jgi:hypothetical protein
MRYPEELWLDDEPVEYDPEYEPNWEELAEHEFATEVELVEQRLYETYGFAKGQHREVLLEAGIEALARCAGPVSDGNEDGGLWLTDEAEAELDRALAREWRKISRPRKTARTRRPQRSIHMRRAGCRPRERRDGSRRTTRTASSGDDPGGGDAGGDAGDDHEHVASRIAGWSA